MVLKLLTFCCLLRLSSQHGRMLEPPSRASMWRLGFANPSDQNDHQSYCGGFGVQHDQNGGRCGICGDAFDASPREHEAPGGVFANGIITRKYKQGSNIPVVIDLTANHQGFFEFKICPNNNVYQDPGQSCFNQHGQLWISVGSSENKYRRLRIDDHTTGMRLVHVSLPMNITCEQCILQWTYVAGNNWGKCKNGTSRVGCGPQETFRACSDILITSRPVLSSNGKKKQDNPKLLKENKFIFNESVVNNQESEADNEAETDLEHNNAMERKKKVVLQRVLRQLRTLIEDPEFSQPVENQGLNEHEYLDKSGSVSQPSTFSQLIPKKASKSRRQKNPRTAGQQSIPWWDNIPIDINEY